MNYLRALTVSLLAVLGLFSAAHAQSNDAMVRTVDSFDFMVDYSGSMMMTNTLLETNKMEVAKKVLGDINQSIPRLGYLASAHTIAPPHTELPLGTWDPTSMQGVIDNLRDDLPIFGRLTPMGLGLADLSSDYAQMPRPTAVVMVSDGVSNAGQDPVAEAQLLYKTQPGLCLHIISVADTPEGQQTLQRMAALNACSVMVDAGALLDSQANVDRFVQDVFYHTVMEEAIILRGVNFAFDSYTLDDQAKAILNEVAFMLRGTPNARVSLEGWTDYLGTDAYNLTLSQRRADAVRDYLIRQGVPGFSMRTMGMGKSFKYDNSGEEGRYLNRRTELIFD